MRRFLVLVVVAVMWPAEVGAAPLDLRTAWPCEPQTIHVDPAAPAKVRDAVEEWRLVFRPDWTYTDGQGVVEVLMSAPAAGHVGLATVWANETTRLRALVEIDPNPTVDLGDTARHELGHVAGLGHHDETQWSAMAGRPLGHRYGALDLLRLAVAGGRCR